MYIGAITKIAKSVKEKIIRDYYYFLYLGYDKAKAKNFALKKFSYSPDLLEKYEIELSKLINKNSELIESYLKKDKSDLVPVSLIKF